MNRRFHLRVAAALLLIGAGGIPVRGQGLNLGGGTSDNKPVQIQADSGIEWQQNAQVYIARGNAVATRGTGEVHADTLIAHYRPTKKPPAPATQTGAPPGGQTPKTASTGGDAGSTEIYRLEAEGHVTIKGPSQTIVGDKAIYDVDQALVIVTGKGLKMTTPSDVVTARDSLEWYDQKQIAVARGDAVAIRNGKTIKADILTAYMVKTAAGEKAPAEKAVAVQPEGGSVKTVKAESARQSVTARPGAARPGSARPGSARPVEGKPSDAKPGEESKISRIDAQGHVVVTNDTDIGRGDYGVYNADTGIATLIGNVALTRGQDVVTGQSAVMDLNRNVSRILPMNTATGGTKRVQGMFVRQEPGGAAGAHPGAKPPTGRAP